MNKTLNNFNVEDIAKEKRSGFLMATLDEDELYAVQNFIAGMKATKEYVKMQEKEKAENPE